MANENDKTSQNDRNNVLWFCLVFLIGMMLSSSQVVAADGASLFTQYCIRCHQSVQQIKIPSEQVANILKSGAVRQHRFKLDDEMIQSIMAYLKQKNS